jgi:hypothetical protein
MSWSQNERALFAALPPADQLPESARELAERFEHFNSEAQQLRGKALEMKQKRERVGHEYEAKLGQAMLDKAKLPTNPLPDYDRGIEDTERHAAGAMRAAAIAFAELGDSLVASQHELVTTSCRELAVDVEHAVDAAQTLRAALDTVEARLALVYWLQRIRASNPVGYAPMTHESKVLDETYGRMLSVLRTLRRDLEEVAEQSAAVSA